MGGCLACLNTSEQFHLPSCRLAGSAVECVSLCFHPVSGWLSRCDSGQPGENPRRLTVSGSAGCTRKKAASASEEGMETEETDGHTPRLQGSLGRRHLPPPPTRSLGGRKWRRRVHHSFPPHLSAWPAPPPAGPAGKRWTQALAQTPGLLDPRGCSLSQERTGGSVPSLSLASAGPLILGIHVSFLFPFPFQY